MDALHRSFPEAGDGRPLPPMGDELMTAGLGPDDARFVAVQLAQNGYQLVQATEIERLRAGVVNLEGRLSAVTTNDMNDFVLMGLARDAAEARVKVLEAAMDKMLFWLDEFSQQVDSSDPACFRSDYNVAVALIDKEAGDD